MAAAFINTAAAGEYKKYVVKKGDTLWDIAKEEVEGNISSTVIKISRENGLSNPDFIVVGQTLKIRDKEYVVKKEISRPEITETIIRDQEKEIKEGYPSKYLAERINLPLVISLSAFIAVFCFFYDQVFFGYREKRGKVNLGHRIIAKK